MTFYKHQQGKTKCSKCFWGRGILCIEDGRGIKDKSVGALSACFYHVVPQMCRDREKKQEQLHINQKGLLCKSSMAICLWPWLRWIFSSDILSSSLCSSIITSLYPTLQSVHLLIHVFFFLLLLYFYPASFLLIVSPSLRPGTHCDSFFSLLVHLHTSLYLSCPSIRVNLHFLP